jgi:ABC-type Fe3+-siderophore transport system permease subunit
MRLIVGDHLFAGVLSCRQDLLMLGGYSRRILLARGLPVGIVTAFFGGPSFFFFYRDSAKMAL